MGEKQMSRSKKIITRLAIAGGVGLLAVLGLYLVISHQQAVLTTSHPTLSFDADTLKKGEYIARLGDCVACHTAEKGVPFAGGLKLSTPFGALYSTNITPDPDNGIGHYSFAQFDRAMRRGIAADGRNLYPAMPYPSYAKIGDEDMQALYAYLMKDVLAAKAPNLPSEMSFPFNQRWGLTFWNWLFLQDAPFAADQKQNAAWNRGAYLVEGLGHCGACHTPRGLMFQEKAMSASGPDGQYFLAGETVEYWRALSLRHLPWSTEESVMLLKTGRNSTTFVSGNMTDVIHNSTQYFTDADLTAMVGYLKSLPPGKDEKAIVVNTQPIDAKPADLFTSRGGLGYVQFCVDCHRQDGTGVPGVFPSLQGTPSVASADPSSLIHIMLTGWKTAQTQTHERVLTMPGFAKLSDEEIAEILSFTRKSWGNQAGVITAAQVKAARQDLNAEDREAAGTFITPRLAGMLKASNAEQVVYGMRLHLDTYKMLPKNVGDVLNCTSCHLNVGTVADGSPFVGVSAFFPSYAPRAGREITLADRINGCFRRSMNGKPLVVDAPEMQAMIAFFDWMKGNTRPEDKVEGRGVGKIDRNIKPNIEHGKEVYAAQCAICHGQDGEGLKNGENFVYPPLWGDQSFNIGAGMARTYTAAAFVKRNMPIAMREHFPLGQGGLSDQDAVDVAEYFSHQPRPDFPDKANDWPKGGKPSDARY